MIKRVNRLIPKGVIGIVLSLLISVNVFPYILVNGSGTGYCDGQTGSGCGETASILNTGNNIDGLITGGAAAYLTAYANYISFLNRVELSGLNSIDPNEAEKRLSIVIESIKTAKDTYYRLIARAESTPYNPQVLDQLAAFDYNGYLKNHGLDGCIFNEVEEYLKNGDITGTYILIYSRVKEIEQMLISAKAAAALKTTPDLNNLWKLNEMFSKTLIFGQYVARIFHEID